MSTTDSPYETPDIWNGEKRETGTEDWANDYDTSPYIGPRRPNYQEAYRTSPEPRPFIAYSTTLTPGAPPIQILGQDDSRVCAYINGPAANSVIIGEQSLVSQGIGYIISGAEKLTTTDEIWAAPAAGQAQPILISWYVERMP